MSRLHISSKDFNDLPKMGLDDTGTMTIKFKVKGANIYDDETLSEDEISYDMEYEITELKLEDVNLNETINREAVRVKTQTSPFPG